MPPLLSVSDLNIAFRGDRDWNPVVRNLSFDIAEKETFAIVGESGSGKSVTALSLMRLLDKNARVTGSVRFRDRDLLALSGREMRRIRGDQIAMIFQEPMTSLNPLIPIGRQISETLMLHQGLSQTAALREVVQLLEKVRIPSAAGRVKDYPHQFSGGMRQRVMIAMALACKPQLLIADEPTTALDVTIQSQILELIKALQAEEGMAVLFITHDMGVVAETADRTMVMYRGNQVETETTERLFSVPKAAYTRTLLSSVPRLGSMRGRALPAPFQPADGSVAEANEYPDTVDRSGDALLRVANLRVRFPIRSGAMGQLRAQVHAIENVSFEVRAGETLALVGESGCGKSTTGRSLLRLVEPQEGQISFGGQDLLTMSRESLRRHRRGIQMVFQDPFASLNPRMRVGDAIAEPLLVHKATGRRQAREKVAQLLEQVGLSADMAKRFPHEFSGGQRQRICIARALALEPKLIIADEAVSALDVTVKAQVINLMLDLQSRLGLSYLFISHDMAVVERVSHRVAVMYLGEIVEIGPRDAIFSNPQHPYTRKLIDAVPVPDPSRRNLHRTVSNEEIRSPIRKPDYVPPERRYEEVSPAHIVQVS